MSEACFTFGIPLLPRACAGDWSRIEALLNLTLDSVFAQTDPDFRVVIACHDSPRLSRDDSRIKFLQADWPVERIRADNLDRGRKTALINDFVLNSGGGLLMFLDADDWIDRRLVAAARAKMGPHAVCGLIESGVAVDFQSLRAAPIPAQGLFPEAFHRLCGSSSVLRLRPGSADHLSANPYALMHEHYRLPEVAAVHGAAVAELPIVGAYVINTAENHSERHGPFTSWREQFSIRVNRLGKPMSRDLARRFGVQALVG